MWNSQRICQILDCSIVGNSYLIFRIRRILRGHRGLEVPRLGSVSFDQLPDGAHPPRMDAIALDAFLRPLIREGFGDLKNSTFACSVRRDVLSAYERDDRSDVDDFSRSTLCQQWLGELLTGDQCGFDVDVQNQLYVFVRLAGWSTVVSGCCKQRIGVYSLMYARNRQLPPAVEHQHN